MKFSAKHSIEPLEARIAPARIINAGAPNGLDGNDVDYTDRHAPIIVNGEVVNDLDQVAIDDSFFLDSEVQIALGDTKIAPKIGPGEVGVRDTFYIRMSAGDVMNVYNTQSPDDPYLSVLSGNIVAFFVDKDGDNEVDEEELTGISMGKDARIILKSGVFGDIVTNLNDFGTKSTFDDDLDMTGSALTGWVSGLVSDKQGIGSLAVTGGRIDGSIISGGNISNVVVSGTVGAILAGTAANGKAFDFYPGVVGGGGVISVTAGVGKAGPSISNIAVNGLGTPGTIGTTLNGAFNGLLEAGGGGFGGKGGAVTFIRITQDADGLAIVGGEGGTAGGGKVNGGAGGLVSRIYIGGFEDPNDSVDLVRVDGGIGGDSLIGKGGAGGALKDVFVGYQFFGTKALPTDQLLVDRIHFSGGVGGTGKIGGVGGAITNADIRVETRDGNGEEIRLVAGNGGANLVAGGKAGVGGALTNITVRNQDLAIGATYSETLLQAGSGGSTVAGGSGAAGGNITNVSLLSWEMTLMAGNGSDGKIGGNGGTISKVSISESDEILAIGAVFNAGFGGAATAGNGGKGGDINSIFVTNSDLRTLIFNDGSTAGNGGNAIGGKGGAGGLIQNVEVRDGNVSNGATQTPLQQPASVRTGSGGDGTKGGGVGGTLRQFAIESTNMNIVLNTGAGGDAAGIGAKGNGGAGGNYDVVSITTRDVVGGLPAFVNATAGVGGNGVGSGGSGGAGGDIKTSLLISQGSGFIRAGAGGDGQAVAGTIKAGAAGRGGSILATQLTAEHGDGELRAGDAGAQGGKAGLGGSITGKSAETRAGLFAHSNLLIQAGHGSHGGAGGSIKYVGYGSGTITLSPTPMGNIVIAAGNGSAEGKVAGVGGSIVDLGGSLPNQDPTQPGVVFSTSITAGNGGGSALRGAAGGSISEVAILTGGMDGSILTVQAGDAGDSPSASTGAKGGNVKNLTISSVHLGTIFRSVAAGDGGDALNKGGAGGNIETVHVDGIDIGDRRDVPFGFSQMGGIFAGKSGAGQRENVSGKVVDIVAKGIASIVAGRDLVPHAVELVDKITLSDDNTLVASNKNVFTKNGSFQLAYDAAVDGVETTPGTTEAPEVQTITLGVLKSANFTTTVYTFGENSTPALAGDATAAQVQTALNALASITTAGGVTVTDAPGGYIITFNQAGARADVLKAAVTSETPVIPSNATATDVKTALDALPTIQYLGLDITGTPADETHTGGSVSVDGRNGGFYVTFNQNGDVIPLKGIEVINSAVLASTEGSITDDVAVVQTPGSSSLVVSELQSGGDPLFVEEFFAGTPSDREVQDFTLDPYFVVPGAQVQFGFSNAFVMTESRPGDPANREEQSINLAAVKLDPRATFTLTFTLPNGQTSTSIPFTSGFTVGQINSALLSMTTVSGSGGATATLSPTNVLTITFTANGIRPEFTGVVASTTPLLPATATEAQMETALNAMAPVKFTSADHATGTVDVALIADNSYFINFGEFGAQPLVSLNAFAQERQEIESDSLDTDPLADFTLSFDRIYLGTEAIKGSGTSPERQDLVLGPAYGPGAGNTTFTISYGNRTSAVLPGNATLAQIKSAVDAMGLGTFTVSTVPATGTIQLRFNANGDQPLTFSAKATSRTAPLDATATETDVQNALNGLATIKGPSGTETVTVARQGAPDTDNDFEVTFLTSGSRELITAGVVTQEEQSVDVSAILAEPTGSFRLGLGGVFTPEFDAATATAAEVAFELNKLSTMPAGGVTVTSTGTALFDVRFNTPGAQNALQIRYEVDEVQEVDYTAGKDLALTVVNNVIADEVVSGAAGISEVQVLNLGDVIGSEAEFTITYIDPLDPDASETTVVLKATASAQEIQDALDDLPSLGAGMVSVQKDSASIQITFTLDGDQPRTFSARATQAAVVSATATGQEVETALNQLATVKASGDGGTGGSVDVVIGAGSSLSVRFASGGNQELVVGTQEQSLNISTPLGSEGDAFNKETQVFTPKATGQPFDAAYAIANLIGFYSDHSELDANLFHYIHNGTPMVASKTNKFAPGDQPIDGILFAKKVNRGGLNVVPEAYLIAGDFFDWNNII